MDQFQDDRNRRKKTSSVSEKSKFDQNIQGPRWSLSPVCYSHSLLSFDLTPMMYWLDSWSVRRDLSVIPALKGM